ncbi:DNA polymerase I [Candidatus Uhrbacteria bacterium CG_4_10_14_0_2_um_filter_41_7]|uniref:DNA polymerase I n=1 Tax=Candidatus Uhrbacteria bacterium CG_4_9_14_3_um_filter_41_35 TaxID=1975034 RepID=A0A2M7XH06_9BACT|nr:MAG: DNA polymerase I [Candidatus Uhrbacteria bacterium CG11_big_fil_rev_8_21_14_0_20_41_9]PIZ55506.1 MAG: DNA polymerase I [Candidatus Uhrbacteria bacterium CG_4_10_14_0_2_um_filter_41_7]PJA47016.1 MAG: DNA polymerase I [Candidatus Uhrbacteria bacterium CG_4_9_14_3_um_filter_41_35]
MTKKKIFVVLDGNALLHRAWHGIPPLTAPDGRIVNAVYGFVNAVETMRERFHPDYMAVAWDLPGKTFRHEEFEAYKGTRTKKEPELYAQIDYIKDVLKVYDIPSLTTEGMEADDICGTLAKKYGPQIDVKVLILTGDMDSLQLVDQDVEVVAFVKGMSETKTYDVTAVKERYGLLPDQLIDLKALMGDSSDNIPGIAGVGKKTATDLLIEFGTIANILKAVEQNEIPEKFAKKFRGQEENIKLMQKLGTIIQDVDLQNFNIEDAKVNSVPAEDLAKLFREFGFRRLLAKYESETKNLPAPTNKTAKKTTQKKTGVKFVSALTELKNNEMVFVLKAGQPDLFGSSIKEILLYNGEKTYRVESPKESDITMVVDFLNASEIVIGHDIKNSMHLLDHIDNTLFDVMVGAYLLAPGSRNFDLETIVAEQLNQTLTDATSLLDRAKLIYKLYKQLSAGLKTEGIWRLSEDIEMPLIPILHKMEDAGIEVDPKKLKELSAQFGVELEELTRKIYQLAGREFNINSPAQLAEILFGDLALPTAKIKKTKTGYSTAASELEKMWEEHKIIPLISEYREFAKLKSTYVDALPLLIKKDGRIHSTFNQTIAATGRLSSSDPNLQNIPTRSKLGNEIRKAFVAPKGKKLVAIDYSQFELRLAAVFSKDAGFIKAFQDGADVHARTAADILDKDEQEVTKQERSAAKGINFGILYGMGVKKLAASTGLSKDEARLFIDKYFAVHPGLINYIDRAKKLAHEREYAETLFGRKRYLPEINGNIHMLVAAAERMAVNMPIQGTQADLVKIAMIDVADWLSTSELDITMLLQVHDELVFEIADADLVQALPRLKEIMESVWKSEIPLLVDTETGNNWGEMRTSIE